MWPCTAACETLLRSAAFGCLQADAACPLLCEFGRASLYVKIGGNRPGDSSHTVQGDRGCGERGIHLCFQSGGTVHSFSFPRLAVTCLMRSLLMELLKYTSMPKNVKIKAVLF